MAKTTEMRSRTEERILRASHFKLLGNNQTYREVYTNASRSGEYNFNNIFHKMAFRYNMLVLLDASIVVRESTKKLITNILRGVDNDVPN